MIAKEFTILEPVAVPTLTRIDGGEFRVYETPEGKKYPSVTSVLSVRPNPDLEMWMAAVGPEEAEAVGAHARKRGTLLHSMAEDYLNNRLDLKKANPMILVDFEPIKGVLDDHVDRVLATELQLYSDVLKTAGTLDLLAEYDGKLSIIDFKTSRRVKYESDIEDYFIQLSAYAYMLYERTGILAEDITILMMVDGDRRPLVFRKKARDYIDSFIDLRKEFEENHR